MPQAKYAERRTAHDISLGEPQDPPVSGNVDFAVVSGNAARMAETAPGNNATTRRVQQHRARAGLIRVEVEVPTRDDALAVRRFAQARRRARETAPPLKAPLPTAAPIDIAARLATMDGEQREITMLFAQALMQTAAPGMLTRGRRVALNFADAVAQCQRDTAFRDNDESR
jgi:hypothetical protein